MENIKFPIYITSSVLFIYALTPFLGVPFAVVFWLFITVNILTIWMVIRILKDGTPSTKTFEESWYDDVNNKS